MHMFMKWNAISGSQTPRVLQIQSLRTIQMAQDIEIKTFMKKGTASWSLKLTIISKGLHTWSSHVKTSRGCPDSSPGQQTLVSHQAAGCHRFTSRIVNMPSVPGVADAASRYHLIALRHLLRPRCSHISLDLYCHGVSFDTAAPTRSSYTICG